MVVVVVAALAKRDKEGLYGCQPLPFGYSIIHLSAFSLICWCGFSFNKSIARAHGVKRYL